MRDFCRFFPSHYEKPNNRRHFEQDVLVHRQLHCTRLLNSCFSHSFATKIGQYVPKLKTLTFPLSFSIARQYSRVTNKTCITFRTTLVILWLECCSTRSQHTNIPYNIYLMTTTRHGCIRLVHIRLRTS